MNRILLILIGLSFCSQVCLAQNKNITFRVDMSGIYVQTNVYITGNFNSWGLGNASYRLAKDTNGYYSITLSIANGSFPVQYKFVNYNNNGNAWANQEHMSGKPCGQGDNRYLALPVGDTILPPVGYNECVRLDSSLVTLRVDMSSVDVSNGVDIAADFQGWNPATHPLANSGNNIFTFTRYFSKGKYIEYKFLNGTTWDKQETVTGPCSYNPSSNPNRYLTVPSHDTVITVKFGSCTATGTLPPPKMAFIGGSSTYGFGSNYPSYMSYVRQLGNLLGPGNASATNFGRNSAAVARMVPDTGPISYWTTTDYDYAKSYVPDILFFMLGANDVKNPYFTTSEYWADTKALLDTFLNINPNLKIWLMTPYRTGLSTEPLVVDSLVPVLERMSDTYGYPLMDIHQESLSNPLFKLNPDSTHTDSTGYAVVAQKIYQVYTTPSPQIKQVNDSIMAPQGYYSYRWYRNGDTISVDNGGTRQHIKAAGYGDVYKVLVSLYPDASDRIISNSIVSSEGALPNDLTNFKARLDGGGHVLLTWNSFNSLNVGHFEMEKSSDGHIFSSIGKIAVNGSSYAFEDKQTNTTGILYYRIASYTDDGQVKYSNIISVIDNKQDKVRIFPNPAHGHIHFSLVGQQDIPIPYTIVSVNGASVLKGVAKATEEDIAIGSFPAGIYFLKIGALGQYRFVKE